VKGNTDRISTENRQYVRTLTNGWRFTLPSIVRRLLGWKEGETLVAQVEAGGLILSRPSSSHPDQEKTPIYLGKAGKVVLPTQTREVLGWDIGQRVAVTIHPDGVKVAPCCPKTKCRSCGSTHNVKEVIANLHLCQECWNKYVTKVWNQYKDSQLNFRKLARR
jgi:bifunctional DNA-binding transcriptional regulator/antitoxin component of YhaV-PrlF toxin-antitoxin module